MNKILTERLTLRSIKLNDYHAMYNNWTYDERVAKYCRWHPHKNIDETKKLVEMFINQNFKYRWIITFKDNDEAIGMIDVVGLYDDNKTAEMGYLLANKYWNKGILTEVLKHILEYLFNEGFTKIIAKHHVDNISSGKVMEKCGMKFTGVEQINAKYDSDEKCDVKCYEITI